MLQGSWSAVVFVCRSILLLCPETKGRDGYGGMKAVRRTRCLSPWFVSSETWSLLWDLQLQWKQGGCSA